MEEVGEVAHSLIEKDFQGAEMELVQTAAVVVAFLESGHRQGWFREYGKAKTDL